MPAARLERIARYPVKSIGGQTLDRVTLTAGQALPGDRRFGVLHADAANHLDGEVLTKWLPKSAFLRGAASPELQAIRGGWGPDGRLHLTHPDLPPLVFDPDGDEAPLLAWVAPLWASTGKAPPVRLVSGPLPLTDTKKPWLSLLSLDSLDDLEAGLGRPLGVDRWRANLWVRGWPAQAERDLRLHQIQIGPVRLKVVERIGRCPATSADTTTGRLDGDMPAALEAEFGHQDFGIYLEVQAGGEIALGDSVVVL
ncbi:MOSC domain-containing protein [Paracoccus suum]|uniref:MOSC domain-containing protein n=1 Tax=Paracoccus suum TaxID=2259340 RepID=A0A344PP15_9RHOB|nr:MOSC domain-containing protein [Paracoccus suum]